MCVGEAAIKQVWATIISSISPAEEEMQHISQSRVLVAHKTIYYYATHLMVYLFDPRLV